MHNMQFYHTRIISPIVLIRCGNTNGQMSFPNGDITELLLITELVTRKYAIVLDMTSALLST